MLSALDSAAVAVSASSCAALAALMPAWVARLPEPENAAATKPPYAAWAVHPARRWWYALAGALLGAGLAAVLGAAWPLLYLVPLSALGVALADVDARTRLLPRRLVLPAYPALIAVLLGCAALEGSAVGLARAGVGWLVAAVLYWLLWKFTPGMGYGDVRLSGLLGLALGYLGWAELAIGLYAGFLLGALAWLPLRLLRIVRDRTFPFGPFMLLGAWVGIIIAPWW